MSELLTGLSIGLAAGVSPGPLQALVVTSTLARGFGAGVRVGVAPLLTDTPIVILSLVAVGAISDGALRTLAMAGGLLVTGMGLWELRVASTVRTRPAAVESGTGGDLVRGALVNVASPHPWLFWVTAGAPVLVTAWRADPIRSVLFLVGFYSMLVGAKVALAAAVAAGRSRLDLAWRRRLGVTGGGLLVVGGVLLVLRAW